MNAAGLVSALEGRVTRWLVLRVVSDHADESATTEFAGFVKTYDGRGGTLVQQIVRNLPNDPGQPESHDALRRLLDGVDSKEPGR